METVWVRTPPRLQEESMDVAHPTQPKPSGGSTGGVEGKAHGFCVLQPSMLATPDLPTRRGRSTWGRAFPFLANREGPPCAPSPACGSRSIRGWDVPPRSRPCVVRTQGRVAHTTTHSRPVTTPPVATAENPLGQAQPAVGNWETNLENSDRSEKVDWKPVPITGGPRSCWEPSEGRGTTQSSAV